MASIDPNIPSPEESRISAEMANDRPTIETAVKAFLSLVCARRMTASMTDQDKQSRVLLGVISSGTDSAATTTTALGAPQQQNQHALEVARVILRACNAHEFPIHKTVASEMLNKPGLTPEKKDYVLELSVVARLWNGLIQSKQKPTRFLGRKALLHAWSDMDVASKLSQPMDDDESSRAIYAYQLAWIREFEEYLRPSIEPNPETVDNDAALIWDADGGASELARRRERRKVAATERGPVTPS